jgi:mono/diheme cytochrome c family protein
MSRRLIRSCKQLFWVAPALLLGCTSGDPGRAVTIDPAVLYGQSCARCHGLDGRGNPELQKTMPMRDLTDPAFRSNVTVEQIEQVIMTGRKMMPAFGDSLSAPKIQAISGHVRRLGDKPPAAPKAP